MILSPLKMILHPPEKSQEVSYYLFIQLFNYTIISYNQYYS